jgi:sugar phosphate isomerase/epimerase
MTILSRRQFVRATAAGTAAGVALGAGAFDLFADPLGLPIGLQLYTVGADLQKDFDETLKRIGEIGYKRVEIAGVASFQGKSIPDVKKSLAAAGLTCPSGHLVSTTTSDDDLAKLISYCSDLGLKYMI